MRTGPACPSVRHPKDSGCGASCWRAAQGRFDRADVGDQAQHSIGEDERVSINVAATRQVGHAPVEKLIRAGGQAARQDDAGPTVDHQDASDGWPKVPLFLFDHVFRLPVVGSIGPGWKQLPCLQ